MIFGILFLAGMILSSSPAFAIPPPDSVDQFVDEAADSPRDRTVEDHALKPLVDRTSEHPDLFRSGIRMMTSLIVVVGIMLLIAYGAKRFLARKGTLPGKETMIRIMATRYLGSKNSLSVIDVDGERFVIGLSPQGISFLTTLSHVPEIKEMEGAGRSFQKVLRGSMNEE